MRGTTHSTTARERTPRSDRGTARERDTPRTENTRAGEREREDRAGTDRDDAELAEDPVRHENHLQQQRAQLQNVHPQPQQFVPPATPPHRPFSPPTEKNKQ
eukprot:1210104-Rhodomonas_salina.1